jgi:ATP-dependent helicase HrpB
MKTDSYLPIEELRPALLAAIGQERRMVIEAPTGSGKSTQVPQMLLDSGKMFGQVVVLQPRRLAARMLATRVAHERNVRLGEEVGYQVRLDDHSSARTRIKYVTEGILLRHMLGNPMLKGIDVVVLDEFHERHVHGDVTLGRVLLLQKTARPDLTVIVMSATLDTARLEKHMSPCKTLKAEGRMFPVSEQYLEREPDLKRLGVWDLAAQAVQAALPTMPEGDVLIFMPGSYEINRTMQALEALPATKGFRIMPLHGELPPDAQDAAVLPSERRKIVVSTNVAETSLTIDGIRLVVDSGLARIARFDAERGINTLFVEKISRASSDQRRGRAGRTAPGVCCRLWTRNDHAVRPAHETPEILRVELSEVMLTLLATGVDNIREFPWIDAPDIVAFERAMGLLQDLGAVSRNGGGVLTPLGRALVAFPLHPRYARMLLAAHEYGCVPSVALIAALTQDRSLLLPRPGPDVARQRELKIGSEAESDLLTLIAAWRYADRQKYDVHSCRDVGVHAGAARQVSQTMDVFFRIARVQGLNTQKDDPNPEALAKCVLLGFPDHVAFRPNMGTYRCELVHGRVGLLATDSSVRRSQLLVACDVREVQGKEIKTTLGFATAIREEWLNELLPGDLHEERAAVYDDSARRVLLEQRRVFRDLVIERRRGGNPDPGAAAALLTEMILAGKLDLPGWNEPAVVQWLARVNVLATCCPDLGITEFSNSDRESVIQQLCLGCYSHRELKEKAIAPILREWLSGHQQATLEKHAPERVTLSNGRSAKVDYSSQGEPSISLPIQSLFGVEKTPTIAMGRVLVVIHILGPNQRSVQVTKDMANFWTEHYPRIKKELQRKYPRHEWR